MKNSIHHTIFTIIALSFFTNLDGQSLCDKILEQGIFDFYEMESQYQFDYSFKRLTAMTKEQIENHIKNKTFDASIPIPMAESFLSLAYGVSDNRERYNRLKETYTSQTEITISQEDRSWIYSKVVNPLVVSAWEKCVTNPKEISIGIEGDVHTEFTLTLTYRPNTGLTKNTRLSGITITGGVLKTGPNKFKEGLRIRKNNTLSQSFKRTDSTSFTIVLNILGLPESLNITIPAIPKPLPVYEARWFDTDERGNPYYKDFSVTSQDRHNMGAIFVDGNVTLAQLGVANARIVDIDYVCNGQFCGWSYNPNGGNSKNVRIAGDAQSFRWWRKWDGRTVTEIYKVYYEIQRGECILNCD